MDLEEIFRQMQAQGALNYTLPNGSYRRADANETIAFARQFEHIMTEVQVATTVRLRARELFPTIVIPDWSDSHTHTQVARVGRARIVGANVKTQDTPQVELYGVQTNAPVRSIVAGYNVSMDDLRKSIVSGIQIDTEKMLAARKAINETEEQVAFMGDTDHGLRGMFTSGNATAVTKVSSTTWDNNSITPNDILADVNALLSATWNATRGEDVADTLCVGTITMGILATKYVDATYKDTTIAKFLLASQPWLKSIEHVPWLDDVGASSKERMLAYKKDPSVVRMVIAQEFEQAPPERKGWTMFVDCRSKTGGLEVRKPKACVYMDSLINATGLSGGSAVA